VTRAAAGAIAAAENRTRAFLAEFARSRLALVGLALLAATALIALLAPWISPQNPYDLGALDILDGRLAPGSKSGAGFTFWLGSDEQGRDLLSAIFYGLRISLLVGLVSCACAVVLGTFAGLVAGYAGGRTDALLMRIVDIQLSFPSILVALILLAILGKGVDKTILALVLVQWAYFARTVRGAALVEQGKDYVQAARCLGFDRRRILRVHLLPNCLPPVLVLAPVQVAGAIALEATLSFLGLGMPVTEPSLGLLIANGFNFMMSGSYWISTFPGLALLAAIVGMNLVADRLRELFDPRRQA